MKFIPIQSISKEHYKGNIYDLNVKNTHTYNVEDIIVGNCSSGLHGVGVTCVNALSDNFDVKVKRDGHIYHQTFSKGIPTSKVDIIGDTKENGTEIEYHPDKSIFKITLQPSEHVNNRLSELASLNQGVHVHYKNDIDGIDIEYHFEDGIIGYVNKMIDTKTRLYDNPFYFDGSYKMENGQLILCDIAFIHDDEAEPNTKFKSFANNVNTYEGGFHLQGFKNAYKDIMNQYGINKKLIKDPIEMKYFMDGMYCIVSVKIPDAEFEGQTKTKLGNKEAQDAVEFVMNEYFKKAVKDKKIQMILDSIINRAAKVKEAEEAARKARAISRKAKKVNKIALPGKLADCANKNGYKEIFFTEGVSASGCLSSEDKIPLADGRILTVWELLKEHKQGKTNYVFSSTVDGHITVQPIKDVFKTKHVTKMCRVRLDNGKELECTPEHRFMLRDGSYKEAQDLTNMDSLMPFNMIYRTKKRKWVKDYVYPVVKQNVGNINGYTKVFSLVANQYYGKRKVGYQTHHLDKNPCNNYPENLKYVTTSEHKLIHSKDFWTDEMRKNSSENEKALYQQEWFKKKMEIRNNSDTWKRHISESKRKYYQEHPEALEKMKQNTINMMKNEKYKEKLSKQQKYRMEHDIVYREKAMKHNNEYHNETLYRLKLYVEYLNKNNIEITYSNYMNHRKDVENAPSWKVVHKYFKNADGLIKWAKTYNHKISSITMYDTDEDVYDLTVPPYNNFAVDAGVFIHNSAKEGRDRSFQAVLGLRGKILNVSKADIAKILNSETIQGIIAAIGGGVGKAFNPDDIRYDKIIIMCFTGDTKVKMLDGTMKTFEELSEMEKKNPNQTYWVYSKDKFGNFVPGKATNPRITGYVNEIIKLTLDNGQEVKCTPNHLFLLKDGTYKEARYLTCDDSLSAIYYKYNDTIFNTGREMIYDSNDNKWEFTHHQVMKSVSNEAVHCGSAIHHIDCNFLNNVPNNLMWMSTEEHNKFHMTKYNVSNEHKNTIKQLHKDGIYEHTYFGNNGYNGSEKQKQMLMEMNQREDIKQIHSENICKYNKTDKNKEITAKLNQREDVKILQSQGKIIHVVACMIRKGFNTIDAALDENNMKNNVVNSYKKENILTLFDSLDDLMQKAREYECNELTDDMFNKYTAVDEKQRIRLEAIKVSKRNQMAQIGKYVLDKGLELNTENYEAEKKIRKSRATKYENLNKYFDSEEQFKEYAKLYNHKIINKQLTKLEKPIPVYDLTVEKYHNFMIDVSDEENHSGIIVHNCDADTDGLHIRTLILTLFYYFMPGLIESGHVYAAEPPLYRIIKPNNDSIYLLDDAALKEYRQKHKNEKYVLNRFKGLGEMNPDQLGETTLNPKTRNIKRITLEDAKEVAETFETLMGKNVDVRRMFIEANSDKVDISTL